MLIEAAVEVEIEDGVDVVLLGGSERLGAQDSAQQRKSVVVVKKGRSARRACGRLRCNATTLLSRSPAHSLVVGQGGHDLRQELSEELLLALDLQVRLEAFLGPADPWPKARGRREQGGRAHALKLSEPPRRVRSVSGSLLGAFLGILYGGSVGTLSRTRRTVREASRSQRPDVRRRWTM